MLAPWAPQASEVLSLSCDVCNAPATATFHAANVLFSLSTKHAQHPCNVSNPIPSQILPQNDPGPPCVSGPSRVLANLKKSFRPCHVSNPCNVTPLPATSPLHPLPRLQPLQRHSLPRYQLFPYGPRSTSCSAGERHGPFQSAQSLRGCVAGASYGLGSTDCSVRERYGVAGARKQQLQRP